MNILIAVQGLSAALRASLVNALSPHDVEWWETAETDQARHAALARAKVIFGNVPVTLLAPTLPLRWVQLDSTGVDAYLRINDGRTHPVIVTNLRAFSRAVGEATLAGILAFYRRLPALIRAQAESRWIKTQVEPAVLSLHGTPSLVLGAGMIGRRIA